MSSCRGVYAPDPGAVNRGCYTAAGMGFNEADTRAKLIDPALHARGWTEDLIRREETAGAIDVVDGRPRRRTRGRIDYTLRVKVNATAQPVAMALLEAKAEDLPPGHGLEQAKGYAACKRLNVTFAFSSNGHLFVEFDCATGLTSAPRPLSDLPTPADLRARYEQAVGFTLESPAARPLLMRYPGGEGTRRYYQDAAIRAVLEKLARGERRALLSLATGAGKTFIAVNLLKRIADAGQLRRALFVCDRDELRSQGLGAFQNVFGADAAAVSSGKPQKNARILVATYQTLDVATDEADANFLTENYPENYFSHIIIDECHRSALGKWSQVLTRNPDAVQIGLTATPREIELTEQTRESLADAEISADNLRHFGPPVYEYDMSQGIEDGYLAACEIVRRDIFLDDKTQAERETGLEQADLKDKTLRDADTGEPMGWVVTRARYEASNFEDVLLLPERVAEMARDLFAHLLATGGPEQKTIIFCARDRHADDVAVALNNLYAPLSTPSPPSSRAAAPTASRAPRCSRPRTSSAPAASPPSGLWAAPPTSCARPSRGSSPREGSGGAAPPGGRRVVSCSHPTQPSPVQACDQARPGHGSGQAVGRSGARLRRER
ncbi:MAG TPA: DEAD/DEAH box helicase family protein [Candidatus Limnocylindrales bacterium]|nr:DEAD/DEAH box helicase family protein [Candidatus Limnocylindrales bacterium]